MQLDVWRCLWNPTTGVELLMDNSRKHTLFDFKFKYRAVMLQHDSLKCDISYPKIALNP